jgi:hypothetical protein
MPSHGLGPLELEMTLCKTIQQNELIGKGD